MTDLRKAAEMALEALEKKYGSWGKGHDILNLNAIVSLRHALIDSDATLIYEATKPEQNFCQRCGKRLGDGIHTCTPPEQEPVGWDGWVLREVYFEDGSPCGHREPPKREWQGLTDEEIKNVWQEIKDAVCLDHQTFARAIEAKLREKNNGN